MFLKLLLAAFLFSSIKAQNGTESFPEYVIERHAVNTKDGYILELERIFVNQGGPPALLMHGFLGSSEDFTVLGPGKSLAHLLADAGYDVWLGNFRGNKFSRNHLSKNPDTDADYWNFSWHEMGIYDLPAMIDYILTLTQQSKLQYIGYSQGATAIFVLCSSVLPDYQSKIISIHALAPAVYLSKVKSPFFLLLSPFELGLDILSQFIGYNEFLSTNDYLVEGLKLMCVKNSPLLGFCKSIFFLMFGGFDYEQLSDDRFPQIVHNTPAGASTKQLIHFFQLVNSGEFLHFDYGLTKNIVRYGSNLPPKYELGIITVPTYLYHGKNDWVTVPKDVERLAAALGNVKGNYEADYSKFNHLDFTYAETESYPVYQAILKNMSEARN